LSGPVCDAVKPMVMVSSADAGVTKTGTAKEAVSSCSSLIFPQEIASAIGGLAIHAASLAIRQISKKDLHNPRAKAIRDKIARGKPHAMR
jgi:hypothetical protein